jgi:hypothetical protein
MTLACNHVDRDSLVTRFAVLGLLNLSTLPDNHWELVGSENVVDSLISIAAGQANTWHFLDVLGEKIADDNADMSSVPPLVGDEDQASIEQHSPRAIHDIQFVKEHGFDMEARRYAALAIGNIAISTAAHIHLANERCIQALKYCLTSPDPETRFNAAGDG